ncbi:MAG: restriction endonuclease subunit S [Adlercreutzia equolifaciens subsp. celatus]|uniref:restriction endonuclease subunit S n=1 Tax=Adlercreutzia equolifaciens TaxID=446660 RepID=UPI003993C5EF
MSDLPLTISAQHGLVDQRDFFNSQVASRDMRGYYLLERGEFAYNKSTSSDSPWGAIKRLTEYEKGCLSTLYICFGLDEGDPDFLVTYYETSRWHRGIRMIAAEGARNHGLLNIAPGDFFETELTLPGKIEEQTAIGALFAKLDSLIALHQRKLDHVKELKKGLLQKMFPKEGANVPELRFPGFTDPWEQRRLGELMDITSVKRVHQDDWSSEGIRFLRARDLVAFSNGEEIDEPLFISEELYEEYSSLSGKAVENDLLVTGVGTIGVPWRVPSSEPIYFKDGNIIWFKNMNVIDGLFFYYSFTSSSIQDFIRKSAGSGTVGTFTIDTGKKTPIQLPSIDEQAQIGGFFQRLDSLIALHQRELDHVKELKKGLLQQMFV